MYAKAAVLAKKVGFSGILIHAGHGFILSQFLSPLFNRRTDCYGGSIEARCQIILDIIGEVRKAVGPSFPLGIRINSSDKLEGGLTPEDALEVVGFLNQTSIDLIDISGGTYFPGAPASSDGSSQGPYFLDFAKRARKLTNIPLMLTGGFKSRESAIDVLASGIVDMVGLGRAMIIDPQLPNNWFKGINENLEFPRFKKTIPGGMTAWYSMKQIAIGENKEEEFDMDLFTAIQAYEDRDVKRCNQWKKKFYK